MTRPTLALLVALSLLAVGIGHCWLACNAGLIANYGALIVAAGLLIDYWPLIRISSADDRPFWTAPEQHAANRAALAIVVVGTLLQGAGGGSSDRLWPRRAHACRRAGPVSKIILSPQYHVWSDALHLRQLARETPNRWDQATYIRAAVMLACGPRASRYATTRKSAAPNTGLFESLANRSDAPLPMPSAS